MYVSQRRARKPNGLGQFYTSSSPAPPGPGTTLPGGLQLPPFDWEAAPQWWQLGQDALQAYQQITGGDSGAGACWRGYDNRPFTQPCPGTPSFDAVARAVAAAPEPEIQKLIDYLLKANQNTGPSSRAELARPDCIPYWVKAILGGKGCVASTFPEAPNWFRTFVEQYGAPSSPQEELPGSGIPPGWPVKAGLDTTALLVTAGLAFLFLPKVFGKGKGRR